MKVFFEKAEYRVFRSSYNMDSCLLKYEFDDCAKYELLEVEVPMKTLSTAGVWACRDGLYVFFVANERC